MGISHPSPNVAERRGEKALPVTKLQQSAAPLETNKCWCSSRAFSLQLTEEKAGDLPEPHAAYPFLRWVVEAMIVTAHVKPKLRARAFLRTLLRIAAEDEDLAAVFTMKSTLRNEQAKISRTQAAALIRLYSPTWTARLPEFPEE